MDENVLESRMEILIQNKRKKLWIRIFIIVACLVALCTAYALIMPAITMEGKTYCGKEEHLHTDSCYSVSENLICSIEEDHTHTADCYEKVFICDKEEHEHTLICYSDPQADIETSADWENELPKKLPDNQAERLVAVAESQLGYKESDKNYIVTDDNEMKGYSRYGAWYEDAYADWSAIFVAFCLNYSDITQQDIPYSKDCQSWLNSAEKLDSYRNADDYIPLAGDIVFLDSDDDSKVDHMAIISEVTALTDVSPVKLRVIIGDYEDEVQYKTYKRTDKSVLGYIKISDEEAAADSNADSDEDDKGISLFNNILGETIPAGSGYYHSTNYPIYEHSKYTITRDETGVKSLVSSFILVPKKSAAYQWEPDTKDWNASGGYNYEVAYCVDPYHYTSPTGGVDYKRELLDLIDEFDAQTKDRIAAIVQNSYPFITEEDMRARLNAAGITREFGRSEMMAATQSALWYQTVPGQCTGKGFPNEDALNGILSDVDDVEIVNEIQNWLLNSVERDSSNEIISIKDAHQNIKPNDDGTYDVTVEVKLNHPVKDGDNIEAILSGAEDEDNKVSVKLESGTDSFSLTLKGLTNSAVNLKLTGVQNNVNKAYFYRGGDHDGTHYQHLIGLSKGSEEIDILYPFYGDDTFVSVKKVWTGNGIHPDSVTVYLLVDGVKSDKYLVLSDENNWQGSWDALPAGHTYEVQEIDVPGYTASIKSENVSVSSGKWVAADRFRTGNFYLIESNGNLFSVNSSGSLAYVASENIINSTSLDTSAEYIWSAEFMQGAGGYRLTANNRDLALLKHNQVKALSADETALGGDAGRIVKYNNSKLFFDPYGDSAAYTCYITGMPNNGIASAALNANSALKFNVYTWQPNEGNGGTEYTITNTPKEIPKTSVSVNKLWNGDTEAERPDAISVTLYANNNEYQTVTIKASDNWSYTWENLPAEDEKSVPIEYTVKETVPDGYISSVKEDNAGEFTITNTKIETTSVSVEKRWEGLDEGKAYPQSVQVYLLADGKRYGENIELSASNAWQYCWNNLPKTNSEGKEIEYSVAEIPLEGFNADIQLAKTSLMRSASDSGISWKAVDKLTQGKTYLIVAENGALASKSEDSYLLKMLNVDYAISNNTLADSTAMWTATAADDGFMLVNNATHTPLSYLWNDFSMRVSFTANAENTPVCYTGGDKISAYWSYNGNTYYFTNIRTSKPYAEYGDSSLTGGTSFTFYELQDGNGSDTEIPSPGDIHYIITNTAGEFVLAETGGIGTHWFILAGALFIAVGLLYGGSLMLKNRRTINKNSDKK